MQIQGFCVHKGYVLYWVWIKGLNSSGNFYFITLKCSVIR